MSSTAIGILVLADLVVGFLVWLYLKDYFSQFRWWKAALIKSLVYSLFFGIGAFGESGGEPGFMLPAPILPAGVVALTENKLHLILQNALIPYGFWTIVLFTFYAIRQAIRKLLKPKAVS